MSKSSCADSGLRVAFKCLNQSLQCNEIIKGHDLGKPSLKKKMTFVILGGGVKNFQNVMFLKVVFKIHFKLF